MSLNRLFIVLMILGIPCTALADARPFAFVEDTYPEGQGEVELEQWFTYRTHTPADHSFSALDLKTELEIGVTPTFDFSLYLANWHYEDSDERTGTRFDSTAAEGIVYLANPVTDDLGLALYGEVEVGAHSLEFEQKLLVQKDIGNWTLAYNLGLETELENVFTGNGHAEDVNADEVGSNEPSSTTVDGAVIHALGASYSLSPGLRVGGEALIEMEYENWSRYEGTSVYFGPNVSFVGGEIGQAGPEWWATATPMFQVTNLEEEPDFQLRLVLGIEF